MGAARLKAGGVIITHDILEPVIVRPPIPNPDITKRVDKLNLTTNTWTQLSNMNVARAGFSLFNNSGDLVAIGGTDGSVIHKSVERYSRSLNTWTYGTSMSSGRAYYQHVVSGGYAYIIGGITVDGTGNITISNAVEKYNLSTGVWTTLPSMPTGYEVAFGVAAESSGGYIYVLSGYRNTLGNPNTFALRFNIGTETWDTPSIEFTDDADVYLCSRILPFYLVESNVLYVFDGLRYRFGNDLDGEPVYLFDAYKFNLATNALTNADNSFQDLPNTRFAGSSVSVGTSTYCIGGVNTNSNTVRSIDEVDVNTPPFTLAEYTTLTQGRSSFGSTWNRISFVNYVYAAGGVISHTDQNFLKVTLNAVPERIRLDGKQTGAVDINVSDENGDSPSSVLIRVHTEYTAPDGSNAIIMTKDDITVADGYGMTTLLPRAEDVGSISMTDGDQRSYAFRIFGTVIDPLYVGESEAVNPTTTGGSATGGGSGVGNITIPTGVKIFKEYKSVVDPNQSTTGSLLDLGFLSSFLSFKPFGTTGKSADITMYSDITWIPIVKSIIDSNEGVYSDMLDAIDRMSRQEPFGGTTLLDAVFAAGELIETDSSIVGKSIYIESDGEENCSRSTEAEILSQLEAASPGNTLPVVSSCFRVVPDLMHLDKSIRDGSLVLEQLATDTNGSVLYVVGEGDIPTHIANLVKTRGFLGYGVFTFQIDLGEECRIESIGGDFVIDGIETTAYFRYAIGDTNAKFSRYSDRVVANDTVTLQETEGRYIRFTVEFIATLDPNVLTDLIVPRMEKMTVTYHKKTTSYLFLTPEDVSDVPHQVAISFDTVSGRGSDMTVATNTQHSGTWNDYSSPARPTMDNNSKIVIPIRQSIGQGTTNTLEELKSIDGFIFEAKYGKWADDSTYTVYTSDGTEVDSGDYKAFPHKGYIVFNRKRTEDFILSVTNKAVVSVATEIVNRVNGDPLKIYGGGFMYSTLAMRQLAQTSTVLPEAINLLLTPLKPVAGSTFTGNYTYYDVKGRPEVGTVIKWYINSIEQTDLADLKTWNNAEWQLAVSGDVVYFSVLPKNAKTAGKLVRSIPVRVS